MGALKADFQEYCRFQIGRLYKLHNEKIQDQQSLVEGLTKILDSYETQNTPHSGTETAPPSLQLYKGKEGSCVSKIVDQATQQAVFKKTRKSAGKWNNSFGSLGALSSEKITKIRVVFGSED